MKKLCESVVRLLQQGESFAVATILDKSGSAPRSEGAKMVVRADGSIIGTIGGGRLEASAIDLARETMAARRPVIRSFDLSSPDVAASDMICGGSGEILVDYIDARDGRNLRIYTEAADILARGDKGWLVTILGRTGEGGGVSRQQCLVKPDGTLIGHIAIDPSLLEKLIAGPARITIHSEVFDDCRFLVEPLGDGGTVYIFGAGHLSQKIAPLAESVGFRAIVLDDRGEYANRDRFPAPVETRVVDSFEELPPLDIDEDSYLVIVTRGHLHDRHVLEQVLRSRAAYVGMIGSRRKRELIYREMVSRGYERPELDRVHAPIGLDIGAETPEELAVSIVGELVKARSEKGGPGKKSRGSESAPCCRAPAEQSGAA